MLINGASPSLLCRSFRSEALSPAAPDRRRSPPTSRNVIGGRVEAHREIERVVWRWQPISRPLRRRLPLNQDRDRSVGIHHEVVAIADGYALDGIVDEVLHRIVEADRPESV